ncbi:hypothetical protein [Chitinophaga rhizophila]|nr:hypothetical protein [Chitinophaga rhizophila]
MYNVCCDMLSNRNTARWYPYLLQSAWQLYSKEALLMDGFDAVK